MLFRSNVTNDNKQTNGLAEMAQSARQWANILAVKGLLTGPPESFAGRGDQTNNNLMECLLTDLSLLEVPNTESGGVALQYSGTRGIKTSGQGQTCCKALIG